jgi:hypothetical protein
MASAFITYYAVTVLFARHLQIDLRMSPGAIRGGLVAPIIAHFATG